MTERFREIGNRIYDIQRALQIADERSEVDVIAWAGNNRASSELNFREAMASDETQPIVIAHGKVIDGQERLYKALRTGKKTIPAFILTDEQGFSVMAVKTAVKRVHPDTAKEIRNKHKSKEDLAHPYYALETRKPSGKDRTCRECNSTIDGDAIYFDRAVGDEPWNRDKGYLCVKHENDADVEKWIRCPRRECGDSVPESEWGQHWRDHAIAASVHRYHTSKVAHCGQCEEDLELEAPKKRTVNTDGTITAEELSRLAGDLVGPEVFERKLRKKREEATDEEGSRLRHPTNPRYRSPDETKQILTESEDAFLNRIEEQDFHNSNLELGNVNLGNLDCSNCGGKGIFKCDDNSCEEPNPHYYTCGECESDMKECSACNGSLEGCDNCFLGYVEPDRDPKPPSNAKLYDQDEEPKRGPYDQAQEWVIKPGDESQSDIDIETGEVKTWHPGVPTRKGQVTPQGVPNPEFPEWQPRVDNTNKSLIDPTLNSAIQYQVDELGTDLARFKGQPRPLNPTIRRIQTSRNKVHYHTVTDETGENYRTVPCGEQYGLNGPIRMSSRRFASSNKRDLARLAELTDTWHDNTSLEHDLDEGFQIRRLNTVGDHIVEGTMMNHCLNAGTRGMMGEQVPHPITGEMTTLPGAPIIPNDPDFRWGMHELPRMFREQGKPFFSEQEQNIGGQQIPAWRYQGPLFSLRSKDNLPKATFFHPVNHETGEMNKLVAHDIYGVNNRELATKYRYRVYQYMLDNLNADTTGADSVTLRWGKNYDGDEQNPGVPEEELTDTEVLSRTDLESRVAEMDSQYKRNETEKVKRTRENERTAHSYGKHGHTYVDDTGTFKTVLCSFGRHTGRTANSTTKELNKRDELLDLYGDNTTERHTFSDGYNVRRLNTLGDFLFEGNMARNCLRQFAQYAIDSQRVPEDMGHPFELSHFPYVMGSTETDDPNEMTIQDRPWRYTGPFHSLRDENGISKATWFHPIDRNGEPNMLVAHDVFGINNSALNDRYRLNMYKYMLHNLDGDLNGANSVTIRWGLTNPTANIETPEHLITNTEILNRDGLMRRIGDYSKKYAPRKSEEKIARIHFSGWRNHALRNPRLSGIEDRALHRPAEPEFGAPAYELRHIYPADVYGDKKQAIRFYGAADDNVDRRTLDILHSVKGNQDAHLNIYRAVPTDDEQQEIGEGDWVTINPDYAVQHGESVLNGDYRILSKKVTADEIWTDGNSWHEWGYYPRLSLFSISNVQNFWGWRNGARNKRKYRPSGCDCWEGYERVPGTKPCAPGSCRKKTGPVEKESNG